MQTTAGLMYERLGDDKKADEHYPPRCALKPDDPDMLNNYGVYLCRKGKPTKARSLLLKAAGNAVYRRPRWR